eukprot:545508-Pleurochrysis_carterae.AAC.1
MRARERCSARYRVFRAVVEPEDVVDVALVVRDVRGRAFLYQEVTDYRAICGDLSVLQSLGVL